MVKEREGGGQDSWGGGERGRGGECTSGLIYKKKTSTNAYITCEQDLA